MIHEPGCDCGAYACELRAKGVTLDPGAARNSPRKGRPGSNALHNSWERGVAVDRRPGGFEMPIIDRNGNPMPIKQYSEKRHHYENIRQRIRHEASAANPT